MMEKEEGDDGENLSSPFWLQNKANFRHGIFRSGTAVLLLSVAAVVLLLLWYANQMLKPNSVKKSWDTLNIVLVLVAAVVGFFSRNRNGDDDGLRKSNPSTPNTSGLGASLLQRSSHWYGDYAADYQDKNCNLRRNSSSYPDLRQCWSKFDNEDHYREKRLLDDLSFDRPDPGQLHRRHRSMDEVYYQMIDEPENKSVIVDTSLKSTRELRMAGVEEDLKKVRGGRSAHRNYRSVGKLSKDLENMAQSDKSGNKRGRSSRKKDRDIVSSNLISASAQTIPSPPIQKSSKIDWNGSGGAATLSKDVFNSLYYKKRQRQKSADNLDSLSFEVPAGPFIQNTDSSAKQEQRPRLSPSTAPQPPPPRSGMRGITSLSVESINQKPPIPNADKLEENSNSSGESPLNRIPPPPQPPSPSLLKGHIWKFVVKGDYVRINSDADSSSDSADPYEADSETPSVTTVNGDPVQHSSPKFCQSPDVNTKAESFITNFRAKLKLEKMHSMKKRELGLSSLGPYSEPK